jgi:hypothetical protein
MKKIRNIFTVSILLMAATFYSNTVLASDPPDPPQGDHGGDGDLPPGGGAPIGGGTFILMGLATVYGGKKYHDRKTKDNIK